jgi:uncharacterized membrane protein YccF (DUF307 family)
MYIAIFRIRHAIFSICIIGIPIFSSTIRADKIKVMPLGDSITCENENRRGIHGAAMVRRADSAVYVDSTV